MKLEKKQIVSLNHLSVKQIMNLMKLEETDRVTESSISKNK